MRKIAGQNRGIVAESNGGYLQVHGADFRQATHTFQSLELSCRRFIERQYRPF